MRLTTVSDPQAAAARAAAVLAGRIGAARTQRGAAHIALAGGSTPRRTYELLAQTVLDWDAVELWFGDERCVGPEDPDSNYRMVAESLLAGTAVDADRVHRIQGELGPEEAARVYARELCERLACGRPGEGGGELPRLDVALLGLGEDGHTASLFPGASGLDAGGQVCVAVKDAPKPPPERVSLSLGTLRAARRCLLLATGAAKADAVAAVLGGPDRRVPASLLDRARLELIVDDAAAPAARAG